MTSDKKQKSPRTVTLTRAQLESIIVFEMSWHPEDVSIFWRLARLEERQPGILLERRRKINEWFASLSKDGGQK